MEVVIREKNHGDNEWLSNLMKESWGSERIVSKGKVYDSLSLNGYVAESEKELVGVILYHIENGECEIVLLESLIRNAGIGSRLLGMIDVLGINENCRRIWLITTNNNVNALRFYQKNGFVISAFYRDSMKRSRELKPEIPLTGSDGMPIRDEIELEKVLGRD